MEVHLFLACLLLVYTVGIWHFFKKALWVIPRYLLAYKVNTTMSFMILEA
jgi:hypothetical protein